MGPAHDMKFNESHQSNNIYWNQQVITVPSGRVTRRVGEDLNLTCKIASDKTFSMMWMMPQDPELQVHRIKKEDRPNEQSVTIYHLEEADTGVYTCVAQHRDTVFKKRVFVSVSVQPVSPGRKLPCFEHSFVCGNGLCIPRRYTCDGRMDCPDGSDEAPGTCGTDPCEDKVLCEDGRCLPRATCCDPATQLGCRLTYMLPCCRKYLASVANASVGIVLVPHQHFGPGVEYLQSSVYTVVSCAVVFILVATVMVAAICRIHMRRSVMATAFRPPRCLPWCRQLHPPATTIETSRRRIEPRIPGFCSPSFRSACSVLVCASPLGHSPTRNIMECVEDELEGDIRDVGQWKRVVGALSSVKAQRLSYERQLDLDADTQARISSDIDQQLQANAFTIAALMTDNLPVISRERWTFQRNERWFEDTLPHLGEFHFEQASRVSPATFRFLVESCRCLLAVAGCRAGAKAGN
ncbi:hypothetical protein HPB47_013759 [Ixodes persulcatus]|uniref:Uncharacterized protein n=1 Tax=Ixodes persulcatus TaxID=34615 RepID=A0AC60QXP1_IXOPE|nr:hypothetical protein HPB47_013759 [Ixodes persulcatus]